MSATRAEMVLIKTHSPPPIMENNGPSNMSLGLTVLEKYPKPNSHAYMPASPIKLRAATVLR